MRHLRRLLRDLALSDGGPTATEYAVMLALIIVVLVGVIGVIGVKMRDNYWNPATYGW